jgi:hypothetical protein
VAKTAKKKPRINFTEIWHEGRKIDLPNLSGPVGQETAASKAR